MLQHHGPDHLGVRLNGPQSPRQGKASQWIINQADELWAKYKQLCTLNAAALQVGHGCAHLQSSLWRKLLQL